MKGWLLDTNVVAELTRDRCDARVRAWAEAQNERYLFISVLTLGEYRKGIANLPEGDPAGARYQEMLDRLQERFGERVIAVTDDVAIWWGMISGTVKRLTGHPPAVIDTLLAATAIRRKLHFATRNVKDVQHSGASVFNPWSDDPGQFPVLRSRSRATRE